MYWFGFSLIRFFKLVSAPVMFFKKYEFFYRFGFIKELDFLKGVSFKTSGESTLTNVVYLYAGLVLLIVRIYAYKDVNSF